MAEDYDNKDLAVLKAELLQALNQINATMEVSLANLRTEMRTELANVRTDMANLRAEYSQRVPIYAAIGGLIGGLIAAAARIFSG